MYSYITLYKGLSVMPTIERKSPIDKSDMIQPFLKVDGVKYIYATPLRIKGFK